MLYGTTAFGGFGGTVFRMNLDGSNYQTLHFFNDIETGTNPQAGLTLFGSRLYGTTQNGGFQTVESVRNGTIFSLNLDGSDFRIEHAFHDGIDGGNPVANLTLAPGGLFGTTPGKGGNNNIGTVFLLAVPEPSSIVLAAVGLIGLAAWGWRRRTGS